MLCVKYGKNRLHGFRGDVVWKCWRRTDDDEWTTNGRRMPAYTVSSPMSLRLWWANKKANYHNYWPLSAIYSASFSMKRRFYNCENVGHKMFLCERQSFTWLELRNNMITTIIFYSVSIFCRKHAHDKLHLKPINAVISCVWIHFNVGEFIM